MYTAQYKAPAAAASKYLCQYKGGGRQNGCSVCVYYLYISSISFIINILSASVSQCVYIIK
jgi:hypothetical protein